MESYKLKPVHPYAFDLNIIQRSMAGLGYQERSVFWTETKRVFSDAIINQMASEIVKAFSYATPQDSIMFKAVTSSGKTWLQGDTFLTADGLHWRFSRINKIEQPIGEFSVMGSRWKLIQHKGQVYQQKIRTDLSGFSQNITQWMVFPGIRINPSKILKPPPSTSFGKKLETVNEGMAGASIKNRLRTLDELRKEELITEKEYRAKRKAILEEL